MAISAAIFDCDGTLVDSFDMWEKTTLSMLKELGATDEQAWDIYVATEPDPLVDMCHRWHDEFGLGEDGDSLYAELARCVAKSYATSCPLLPGAREILRALYARHIPITCASSTALPLLRIALGANGILHYFDHVISTGGDIPDKNNPDVWLHACKLMGSEPATTWVFEDGPFSFRSAKEAGCPTVCIYSKHRDYAECKALATKLIHSYPELSVAELEDYTPKTKETSGSFSALLVAGSPVTIEVSELQKLAADADYIVAADSGINSLYAADIVPDVYVGDLDSADSDAAAWAKEHAKRFITSDPYKYATDFKMALLAVQNESNRRAQKVELTVTNATGGRQDHALGILGNLKDYAHFLPKIVAPHFVCYILKDKERNTLKLSGIPAKTTLSICAISPCEVRTSGLEWNLFGETFYPFSEQSISNMTKEELVTITIEGGAAAIYVINNFA